MTHRLAASLALLVAFSAQTSQPQVFTPTPPLAKGAAITGIVRDQDGQPVQGAAVSASSVGGSVVRSAATDDLGRYRLSPLPPGDFVVDATITNTAATPGDGIRAMEPGEVQRTIDAARAGARTADPARPYRGTTVVWGRVYYPGTTDRSAALSVSVAGVDERSGIDIQLQLVTTHRIEGTVMVYGAPVQGVRVTVKPSGTGSAPAAATPISSSVEDRNTARTDVAGHYAIAGLIPGTYEVLALNAVASPCTSPTTRMGAP